MSPTNNLFKLISLVKFSGDQVNSFSKFSNKNVVFIEFWKMAFLEFLSLNSIFMFPQLIFA